MSIVEANRKQLEALGEYVIRANASSGWFAVFPKKLEVCRGRIVDHDRTDFNLVAYRTVGGDERDSGARNQCIAIHGPRCAICAFDFGLTYGSRMSGFIHVHHVMPLHQIGERYTVNPKTDLIPVCPNCHAVIHSSGELMSIEAVRHLLKRKDEDTRGNQR